MRLLMLGTGPFAVPTFQTLLDDGCDLPALITRPTPPPKGRVKIALNPMRDLAEARQVPVFAPDDINAPESLALLQSFAPDVLVVCDYGQILSPAALATARLGGINLHGSLLPKYRGAAPVQWAVLNGDAETGVTVIHMTPRLDGGPALVVVRTPIGPNETTAELEPRLAALGVAAVRDALQQLQTWDGMTPLGIVQDNTLATKAPRLKKEQGAVRWNRPARELFNQVRGLKPWPGTYTHWLRPTDEPLRLILDQVSVISDATPASVSPGEIISVSEQGLHVATGRGVLSVDRVQPAGKKSMTAAEFLRGHAITVGQRLGG